MNVQTGTCPHAHRSALILWGVIGVSVKRAISWKKTGKRALKGREVRRAFYLYSSLFYSRKMCVCVERDTRVSGSGYTLQVLARPSEPLQPGILLSSGFLAVLEKTSQMVQTVTELVLAPHKGGGGVDLLLPPMGLSSITTFSEMTREWKIQGACSFWDISG